MKIYNITHVVTYPDEHAEVKKWAERTKRQPVLPFKQNGYDTVLADTLDAALDKVRYHYLHKGAEEVTFYQGLTHGAITIRWEDGV